MSATTAQQRRGRGSMKVDMPTTILVHENDNNGGHKNGNTTIVSSLIYDDDNTNITATSNDINNSITRRSNSGKIVTADDDNGNGISSNSNSNDNNSNNNLLKRDARLITTLKSTVDYGADVPTTKLAAVHRKLLGTGPFDRYWFNMDCCGIICALLTYALHLYALHVVYSILIPPWMSTIISSTTTTPDDNNNQERTLTMAGLFHRFIFTTLTGLAIIAHFKAMTTDPGAVPPDAKPLPDDDTTKSDNNNTNTEHDSLLFGQQSTAATTSPPKVRRLCRRCKSYKPQRAHHCSICRRCIIKMDHHCPWVNNCVGIGNHKYFLLFVFYTFLTCMYSLVMIIFRFSTCVHGFHHHKRYRLQATHIHDVAGAAAEAAMIAAGNTHCLDKPTQLLNVLGLLIEALLFGMFTSCMMFDQADVIKSKVTHIDRLKGEDVTGTLPGVAEVFGIGSIYMNSTRISLGDRFRMDWLSPFARVRFPPSLHDEVMGFCRPCLPRRSSSSFNTTNDLELVTSISKSSSNPGFNSPTRSTTIRSVDEIM